MTIFHGCQLQEALARAGLATREDAARVEDWKRRIREARHELAVLTSSARFQRDEAKIDEARKRLEQIEGERIVQKRGDE